MLYALIIYVTGSNGRVSRGSGEMEMKSMIKAFINIVIFLKIVMLVIYQMLLTLQEWKSLQLALFIGLSQVPATKKGEAPCG